MTLDATDPLAAGVGDSASAFGDGDSKDRKNDEGERTAATRAVAVCQSGDGASVGAGADESAWPACPRVVHPCRKNVEATRRSGRLMNKPCRLVD